MAYNTTATITYPTATGVAAPPAQLVPFANNSASTGVSDLNYANATPAVTTPLPSGTDPSDQYIKGEQEYPR